MNGIKWESQVTLKQWDDPADAPPDAAGSGGMLRQMFFGSMFSRKPSPSGDSPKDDSKNQK